MNKKAYVVEILLTVLLFLMIIICLTYLRSNAISLDVTNMTVGWDNQIDDLKQQVQYYKGLYENGCETYKMWNLNLTKDDFGLRGVYYEPEFYCVWTKGFNMSDVAYAQNHELAHVMIQEDYNHFCGDI